MKRLVAPVVACEISDPPTTPRGVTCSRAEGLTTRIDSGGHAGELAAGDVEDLPVDEVRPRRAEEEDAARGLLRRAGAAERDEHRGHPAHLLRDAQLDALAVDLHLVVLHLGGGESRLDPAERDRV